MTLISIVYHSKYGHTQRQATSVLQGVESIQSVQGKLIAVSDVDQHWDDLEKSDGIIFGSPTYLGSVSADFKIFMEKTSPLWQKQLWRDKFAAGFTNSSSYSGDKLNTLIQMSIFAAQHSMIWISLGLLSGNHSSTDTNENPNRLGSWLGAMSQSNTDQSAEQAPPPSDLATAHHLGARVASLVQKFHQR